MNSSQRCVVGVGSDNESVMLNKQFRISTIINPKKYIESKVLCCCDQYLIALPGSLSEVDRSRVRRNSRRRQHVWSRESPASSLMWCYRSRSRIWISFQDLYRKLLQAESDGILEDVNMLEVEKLILDPEAKKEWKFLHSTVNLFFLKSDLFLT